MSSLNDDGVEVGRHTTHPGWCSPVRCHDTGSDVEHSNDTLTATLGGQRYEFTLLQLDEHAYPDQPGETRLRVGVTELEIVDPGLCFEVPVDHLDRLIERLTVERNRARFLACPVVHTAVAS